MIKYRLARTRHSARHHTIPHGEAAPRRDSRAWPAKFSRNCSGDLIHRCVHLRTAKKQRTHVDPQPHETPPGEPLEPQSANVSAPNMRPHDLLGDKINRVLNRVSPPPSDARRHQQEQRRLGSRISAKDVINNLHSSRPQRNAVQVRVYSKEYAGTKYATQVGLFGGFRWA